MTRHAEDADTPANPAAPVVLLLGDAETSRELTLAFQRLGAVVTSAAADNPDFVVAQSDQVPADQLGTIAETAEVFPTPRALRLSLDREGLRRLAADELGLPTAPFWFAGSAAELTAIAEHAGFPLAVTPLTEDADTGRSVLLRPEDVGPAWERAVAAGQRRVMAETVVDVDDEITLLTVRTSSATGPAVHFCEPIGHRVAEDGTLSTWQSHRLTPAALDAAKSIAARIVNSLGGRGAFAVELLVRADEVYFSGVRPRPVDATLLTLRTQRLSVFDLHARAILGLPVDTIMVSPGAAEIGRAGDAALTKPDVLAVLAQALEVAESDVWVFDRGLGAAFATAQDVTVARDRAQRAAVALRKLWQS
ncbi:ATP-grasp domain-containing protein [Mycobacterium sp. NPDC003323]